MSIARMRGEKRIPGLKALLSITALTPAVLFPVYAQDTAAAVSGDASSEQKDVIIVKGIRRSIQSSIEDKKNASSITDVITSKEIGDLPALSIGEVLETITGAGANRSRVGATEFALRGLGPFFGATTFNGREASNGSGDRSVNFSQFPSELISTVRIYKSQQPNHIEGGISGVIELETLRPLELDRRIIQLEGKLNYNTGQSGLADIGGPGWRGTLSYVDQYDAGALGEIGISIGGQINSVSNPVDTYGTGTTWIACNDSVDAAGACPQVSRADVAGGTPFYLTPTARIFRQTETDDRRDAVFAAVQWRPNDRLDINLDGQFSNARFDEVRHDLGFSEAIARVVNRVVSEDGILLSYDGITSLDSTSALRNRGEKYWGGGANIAWQASDKFKIIADFSYSDTRRDDLDRQVRLRTDAFDIDGNVTPVANQRVSYSYDGTGGEVPVFTVDPRFDLNDHSLFSDDLIIRRRDRAIKNTIIAGRLDGEYEVNAGPLTMLRAGARFSEQSYEDSLDSFTFTQSDRTVDRSANLACRIDFPQSDFLGTSNTNVITSWATFDPACQFREYLGAEDPGGDGDLRDTGNRDVTEETIAAYVMADFATELGSFPFSGNLGVRFIDTDVTSIGLRSAFTIVDNGDGTVRLEETGDFDTVTIKHNYSEFLPSINTRLELRDDVYFRSAVYRAMVRSDPSDLGAGRDVLLDSGDVTNAQDAIRAVIANGNPMLDPLFAWNFDVSLEYYPNPDSLFAVALYYKIFEGATVPVVINETFTVDGVSFTVPVTVSQSTDESSELFGIEATGQYRFSFLPHPLDGLSLKVSYNYTTTDFETEDIRLGAVLDPVTGNIEEGIIEPVSLNGQTDHLLSTSLLYQIGNFELQGIYKYRSAYFQKFVGGGRQNRVIRSAGVVDLRASYALSRNFQIKFEVLNLTNEPKLADMPIPGSIQAYESFGRSFFLGGRYRF